MVLSSSWYQAKDIGRFFAETDVRYIVYEKQTRYYFRSFGPEEDKVVRQKSLNILSGLANMGSIEVFYDDASYTFTAERPNRLSRKPSPTSRAPV